MQRWKKIQLDSSNNFFVKGKKRVFNMFPSNCVSGVRLPVATVRCGRGPQCLGSYRGTVIINRHYIATVSWQVTFQIFWSLMSRILMTTDFSYVLAIAHNELWWPLAENNLWSQYIIHNTLSHYLSVSVCLSVYLSIYLSNTFGLLIFL